MSFNNFYKYMFVNLPHIPPSPLPEQYMFTMFWIYLKMITNGGLSSWCRYDWAAKLSTQSTLPV